jgi:hypothetical protein
MLTFGGHGFAFLNDNCRFIHFPPAALAIEMFLKKRFTDQQSVPNLLLSIVTREQVKQKILKVAALN